LFREKETQKVYNAIVRKRPQQPEGTLVHWLLKDEKKNKTTIFTKETKGALKSELSYTTLGTAMDHWFLEVRPVTGRSHQIRAQLAGMGCVIKGDLKYGDDSPSVDGSIYLHARRLTFVHPVKKENMTFEAPFPKSGLWNYFTKFE
jgi:23S rRNA pseudouridine1911/1915/1917 synthase